LWSGCAEEKGLLAHGLIGSGVIFRRLAGLNHFVDFFWWVVLLFVAALLEVAELLCAEGLGLESKDVWRELS
jgi:hypothetical protein